MKKIATENSMFEIEKGAPPPRGKWEPIYEAIDNLLDGENLLASMEFLFPGKPAVHARSVFTASVRRHAANKGYRIIVRSEGNKVRIWKTSGENK